MKIIKKEKLERKVKDQEIWSFDIEKNGIYIISVSARCKNWLQNFRRLFGDDDLAVQVDNYLFAEIKGKKREFASSGSWNGNEIKNNTKTVLFVLPIKSGSHKITFWAGGAPFVEEINIYNTEEREIDLILYKITGFGKFLDVIVKNLKTEEVNIRAKANISSKLEIKIDGKVQKNPKYKRFEKWYWYGQELKGVSKDYELSSGFDNNKHSIQFVGEGTPEIESIKLKINTDGVVYESGYIRLYKDINPQFPYLYSKTSIEEKSILAEIKDGQRVGIHTEQVKGDQVIDNLSNIWHEVIYNGVKGFVLSSFVEIDGQEREKIIDLIREKSNQYNADANLMLAIAGKESHFKPFAVSPTGPKGIFQLAADARTDVGGVSDPFNMYQNVEGGIKYYKLIEKRFTGKGDILVKRLAAWHDGPTGTSEAIRAGTFSYDKLSNGTKSFIKSVKANMEKRNWYHIISLSIVIMILVSSPFLKDILFEPASTHLALTYLPSDFHEAIKYSEEARRTYISSSSVVFNDEKYETAHENEYLFFPNVFVEATTSQVIFLNSNQKIVGKIDAHLLNLDEIGSYSIDSVVIENPKDVFYFFTHTSCGASNCWLDLYRFNANKKKLEIMDIDIFGGILELHFSPDSQQLAVIFAESGGSSGDSFMTLYDILNFNKQKVESFSLNGFSSRYITKFSWINNNEINFNVDYLNWSDPKVTTVLWSYDVMKRQIKEIKRQTDSYGI